MNKQKKTFTSLDIAGIAKQFTKKLQGLRLANIYDVDMRTFIFKFQKSDKKECVVIENGVRIHTTDQPMTKKSMPTGFTMKFRKNIKGKTLQYVQQIGVERVLDLQFGQENAFHIILEFYGKGNIILTDKDYKIIQCINTHKYTEEIQTAVGQIYPFEQAAGMRLDSFDLSIEKIKSLQEEKNEVINPKMIKKFNKSQGKKIKDILFKIIPCFSPQQIDHFLIKKGLNPNDKTTEAETLQSIAKEALEFFEKFIQQEQTGGYLIPIDPKIFQSEKQQDNEDITGEDKKESTMPLIDFSPVLLAQHNEASAQFLSDFDNVVDHYFQKLQTQIVKVQTENKKLKALQNVKLDQERRLKKLQEEKSEFDFKAKLIEAHIQDVNNISNILSMMVSNGLDWENINKQISESRKMGDPLALLIHKINWKDNEVIILLENIYQQQFSEMIPVSINFDYNAYQNIELYYKQKKKNTEKEQKTQEALNHYIKQSKNMKQEITIQQNKKLDVINARKYFWFEKFYWFITSENYLVLSGRDQQQNEMLVKKYLRKDDIYMHADYHGASSTIIRNHMPQNQVPRAALDEAAVFALCRSKAWDSKIVSNVWWVFASQVSKSAPTGEYLPTGSFMIRGKKNFCYPSRMELGLTLVFRLEENCVARHANERKLKQEVQSKQEIQDFEEVQVINMDNRNLNYKSDQQKIDKNNQNSKNQNGPKSQNQGKMTKSEIKKQKKIDHKNKEKEENQVDEKNQKSVKRGQKKKLQKIKKYEDQDEDEREMMLKLLGSKKTKIQILKDQEFSKKNENKNEISSKEQQQEQEKPQKIEQIKIKNERKNSNEIKEKDQQKEEDSDSDSDNNLDENREYKKENNQQIEENEDKIPVFEEEQHDDDQQVENQQDLLVGNPHPDDNYFFCMLMCAPYQSIQQHYKYKVKLTPGILKKGKAVKQAFYLFQGQEVNFQRRTLIQLKRK